MDVVRGSEASGMQYQPRASTSYTTTTLNPGATAYDVRHSRGSVVDIKEGVSRVIGERYNEGRIVREYTRNLQERVIQPDFIPQERIIRKSNRQEEEEEPIFVEKFVDKMVDVIVERKVPRERIVEVPYDVIVERPIERIIEKEIEIEKIVHKEIEKTVEVPIEKIVEIPVEEIIEQPVEVKKYINVPYETVSERMVEDIHENIIYHDQIQEVDYKNLHQFRNFKQLPKETRVSERRVEVDVPVYRENLIEKVVDRPYEKIIEVPKEQIVERRVDNYIEVPVYYDNIIEKEAHVPVERIVERPVEHVVEVPVFRENIINKPVPYEVEREVIQEVPVEHRVEIPYYTDNIIEKVVEVPRHVEVPVVRDVFIDIPTFNDVRAPVTQVTGQRAGITREVPRFNHVARAEAIEYEVWRNRPVPQEHIIQVNVPNFRPTQSENVLRKQVQCEVIVEQPIEVRTTKEVVVENVIERPRYIEQVETVEIPIDQVIEEEYEVVVPNIIRKEVVKEIMVPQRTITQRGREHTEHYNRDLPVGVNVQVPVDGGEVLERDEQILDDDLARRINENRNGASRLSQENARLVAEIQQLKAATNPRCLEPLNHALRTKAQLDADYSELQSRVDIIRQDKQRLEDLIRTNPNYHNVEVKVPSRQIAHRAEELRRLLQENERLVQQARGFQ